ncbi:MAG: ECF transporter S component [Clostridia bacterium]|nr:ECF transporter S component [Clostridia bacterium]
MKNNKTFTLVQLALLTAIELILAFTPIGYLRVGIVEITFMTIPIAVGAMLLGPASSLFLGCVFGLTSFVQCFGISVFGTTLFGINPLYTFILCFVPRALMGWLTGVIFRAVRKVEQKGLISFTAASCSAALLNTIFFVLFFYLFFHGASLNLAGAVIDVSQMNILDVLVFIAGINGAVEVVVCTVLSTVLGKALVHLQKKVLPR